MIEHITHILIHTLEDSAKMLPFLYVAYLLIEAIERYHGQKIERALANGGRWGFVPGALLGCVPQCGFSAMASNFYSSRVITLGTLMAVFLSTSDEAIPMLMAVPDRWPQMALLIGIKVSIGLLAGFLLDFACRKWVPASLRGGYTGTAETVDCHEHHEEKSSIWWAAFTHTLNIFVFILGFSILIELVVHGIGEEAVADFLNSMGFFQPAFAALIGLIPNCAASVLLTQLYLGGSIGFASVVAGLCSGAGVGLAVLYRTNPSIKQNLFITGLLWALGAAAGLILQMFGL